jgi:hypothetical protein
MPSSGFLKALWRRRKAGIARSQSAYIFKNVKLFAIAERVLDTV